MRILQKEVQKTHSEVTTMYHTNEMSGLKSQLEGLMAQYPMIKPAIYVWEYENGKFVYYEGDEGYCFHDSETKTDAGIRDIPMTQMVYDAFREQRELNLMLGLQSNVEIGGRSGFIFNTKHGRPIMPAGVNSFLKILSMPIIRKKANWQKKRNESRS